MTQDTPPRSRLGGGLPYALGCYLIWGLLPLYLHRVDAVPAVEFVAWRVLFTLPVCAVMIVAARRMGPLMQVLRNPRNLGVLTVSATLIGINWLTYIIAVDSHHLFAAAIGYYLNPLINVALGTLVLGERLRRAQWVATGFAASGVAVLAVAGLAHGEGATLWLSLILAGSFAFYGLIRKKLPVEPLVGLTMEA